MPIIRVFQKFWEWNNVVLVGKTFVSESACVTKPSGSYIQASPDYGFLSNFFAFISSKIKGNETSNGVAYIVQLLHLILRTKLWS